MKGIVRKPKPWCCLLILLGVFLLIGGLLWLRPGTYIIGVLSTFFGILILLSTIGWLEYLQGLGRPLPFNELKADLSYSYKVFKIIEINDRYIGHEHLGIIIFDDGLGLSYAVVSNIPQELKEGMNFTRKKEKQKIKLIIDA